VRSRWHVSPVAAVLGIVGAFLGVLALSALCVHPAGAATRPGSGGSSQSSGVPTIGLVSTTTQSAVALVSGVVDADNAVPASNTTTGSSPAARPVLTLLQAPVSAAHGLAPVIGPIAKTVPAPVTQVVTTLNSVPTAVTGALSPVFHLVQPAALIGLVPGTDATTTIPSVRVTDRSAGGSPGRLPTIRVQAGVHPRSPRPLPAPGWPLQGFPLVTGSSAAGESSSSAEGTALAFAPVPGPLLPDPLVSGVIPAQGGLPRLLLDLRSSPPG
jgi:hypothetical protein